MSIKKSHLKKKTHTHTHTKESKIKNNNTGQSCPINLKKKKREEKRVNFRPKIMCNFSFQFSLHFRKKIFLWVMEENSWTPPFIFLPPHPTKHITKKFAFPFSLQSFLSILFHL